MRKITFLRNIDSSINTVYRRSVEKPVEFKLKVVGYILALGVTAIILLI